MIKLMALAFTMIAVTGCSNSQLKTPDTAQLVMPSIEYSVAEVDMSEFGHRGY